MAKDCTAEKTRDDQKSADAPEQDGPVECRFCGDTGHIERFCSKNPDKGFVFMIFLRCMLLNIDI